MKKTGFLYRAYDLYVDGFRNMKLGKTLCVLKLFFFPNFLSKNAPEGDKAGFVSGEMLERADVP